jgi:hypothetical protein
MISPGMYIKSHQIIPNMEDYADLNSREGLEAENDFLKMKLMLEHGASFTGKGDSQLSPEIENEFLKNVMAFEEKYAEQKLIKIFDKLGRPDQFRAVQEIPDEEIEDAWKELREFLNENGVDLAACSPKVTARELYRFTTEELFGHEMDDLDLPGWTTNFIYDEFHPDIEYNNTQAVKELLGEIFTKEPIFYKFCLASSDIIFNGKIYEDFDAFEAKINSFKFCFEAIELEDCDFTAYRKEEVEAIVSGNYKANAESPGNQMVFSGGFVIRLIIEEGYWLCKEIEIKGLNI